MTKDLTILVTDINGDTAGRRLSEAVQGPLRPSVSPAATVDRKSVLETYRFSLRSFVDANPNVDLSKLVSISFVCNQSPTGRCLIDDIALSVPARCLADLDGDGTLTIFDFLVFQNLFDNGDPAADFDGDGTLTFFDFLAFQDEFAAGCP